MFGPPEDSPLNNRDYTRINDALAALNRAERKIAVACEAGVDCEQRKAEVDFLRDRLEKMKAVYFPHKP